MKYNGFFVISCLMGEELYRDSRNGKVLIDVKVLEARYKDLCVQTHLTDMQTVVRRNRAVTLN